MNRDERDEEALRQKKTQADPFAAAINSDENKEDAQHFDKEPGYQLEPVRPSGYYTAFRMGRRRERLRIDSVAHSMQFPAYHSLSNILFDGDFQTGFFLFFLDMQVKVTGKNLWPVAHAISRGVCDVIHQYHPDWYPGVRVKDGDPLIQTIEILPPPERADRKKPENSEQQPDAEVPEPEF